MSRTVLITGAARGIGRAIALELAEQGYDIVINYLTSENEALELKSRIEKDYGVRCMALKADVSDAEQVDEMAREIEATLGKVDVLINNAQASASGVTLEKHTTERVMVITRKEAAQ